MKKKNYPLFFLVSLFILVTMQCKFDAADWNKEKSTPISRSAAEEKVYCNATMENDFCDQTVVMVLSREASMNFKTYGPEDFPEVVCEEVVDATALTLELVKKQRAGDWDSLAQHVENGMLVDVENFRRLLYITLAERGKENVLNTIRLLQDREDLHYVGVSYALEACGKDPDIPLPAYYDTQQKALFTRIGVREAWEISTGKNNVVVGVLDTGIDGSHPALSNRLDALASRDFSTGLSRI